MTTRPWASGEAGHITSHNNLPHFIPEDYGAVGDETTDDSAALRAAVADIKSRGGGVLKLTKKYGYKITEAYGVGTYTNVTYGILVDLNNVFVDGPGGLKLLEMPDISGGKRPIGVLFNKTGPLAENPGNGGVWIQNVGVRGVHFDNSLVSYANRQTITAGLSSCVNFAHAKHFECSGNLITGGFGEGSIHTILGSYDGSIVRNAIHGTGTRAMWIDGLRASVIAKNRIIAEYFDITEGVKLNGIVVVANTDNGTGSSHLEIVKNIFINPGVSAIGAMGEYLNISENICYWNNGTGITGIYLNHGRNAAGTFTCSHSKVTNNIMHQSNNIAPGKGIDIYGVTESPFDGEPVVQDDILVTGNKINGGWQAASVNLGEQVTNSWVVGNYLADDVVEDVTGVNNVITPNY